MTLETFVNEYIATLSAGFFAKQYIMIICLFVFGAVLSDRLSGRDAGWVLRAAMAYPLGICAFAITAYVMIVIGIPYNKWTVCAAIMIEAAAAVVTNRKSYAMHTGAAEVKHMLICAAAVMVAAFIAVCGVAPVIISNDSMYFYRRYPDCIVYYQGLRDQFDFWMTDTGLGAVAIDTIPALFGFGESFGIREFFHINFIVFFGACVYEKAGKYVEGKNKAVASVVITSVLVAATPFVILGHWGLANMYFMELFFIAAYYTYGCGKKGFGATVLLLTSLALFRIEGTMFVVWLIICLAYYCRIGKELAKYVLIPMAVIFGSYCIKIFTQYYLFDNIYLFLTPVKALLLVGAILLSALYISFIQPRLPERVTRKLPYFYIGAMIFGNLMLLCLDSEHYIGNIQAFGANLFRQSGWGMLPYFAVSTVVLFGIEYVINCKRSILTLKESDSFNLVLTAGFILIVLAAAFGRGDILMEDVGDSGNRVLLQITPLIVIMFGELGMSLVKYWDEK